MAPGEKLGPYEMLSVLGAGGMGQVWKARDTRLNRTVAIKTSNKGFTERFQRETHAIAALNHPNICTLYDVGPDYLVMEMVEGKPIQGPLPVDEAVKIAGQILDALDAAHRKGITHRDLKPGNILLGSNGVKVLDFGLAKFERPVSGQEDATLTMPLTGEGAIMGTPQYMAPEQLEGKEGDARSDIFSFGVVLYELIAGQRPFTGKTQANLLASILRDEAPPLHELQPSTPPGFERVLQTCLEKDPDKRWQSAREIKHAMEWSSRIARVAPSAAAPGKKFPVWQSVAAVAALVAAGVAGWLYRDKPEAAAAITRFQVEMPRNVVFSQYVSLSPDGRKLVFNATGESGGLWIRDLDSLEWRQLAGTQNAVSPFWSPDSKLLGFGVGRQLKKIDIAGGPAQTVADTTVTVGTGSWSSAGVIIFGGRGPGPVWKVSQAGGKAEPVTQVDTERGETFHALPTFMPDGKHFIYLRNGPDEVSGMYRGSLDVSPAVQSKKRLIAGQFAASYVNGYLFFMREHTLMAQPFDPDTMQLSGEPSSVAGNVTTTQSIGVFSVSPSGVLAYRAGSLEGNYLHTWFDRQGKMLGTFGQNGLDQGIALSPDGTRAVIRDAAAGAGGGLWTYDFARDVRTRFTFLQSTGSNGVWSPDGSRIAFAAGSTADTIYEKASSGADQEKELLKEPGILHVPTSWSRDGRFLLYNTGLGGGNTNADLFVLPLEGNRKPAAFLNNEFYEGQATFSPDMRWIAYVSNESGRNEVYVRPFVASGPGLGEREWQISKDGGTRPKWRGDGEEIFFAAPLNGNVKMAVQVKASGSAMEVGIPQRLFQTANDIGWDVTADGQRFIVSALVQPSEQTPITVVLNWQQQLKK